MSRRGFLKVLGLGGSVGALGGFTRASPAQEDRQNLKVGSLDLAELEIIDAHVHPPNPMTLAKSYEGWNGSFVNALLPAYEYEHKEELRGKLWEVFEKHIWALPRQTGYNNYMARVYGVEPTLEGFDSVVSKKIQGDFSAYIRSILDREKIAAVLLQSRGSEPVRPQSHIPSDRFVWSYSIGDLIMPDWAKKQGASSIEDVVQGIDKILETCASNGCVGIKIPIAYQRPISVEKVDRDQANADLRALLRDAEAPGLRSYQDYLLRHAFIRAGELDMRVIIHTAVGLHPALRFDWNSPLGLYSIFQDDEIKRVETQFVLIHTGYPLHHHVAAFISQFPNVHTDVSFYAKFPGILEETLRAFLSLAPSEQTMHGSDSNNVPEEIGYCADNMRRVMAKVLNDFRGHYGWTQRDCEKIARNVFSENARRIYRIAL